MFFLVDFYLFICSILLSICRVSGISLWLPSARYSSEHGWVVAVAVLSSEMQRSASWNVSSEPEKRAAFFADSWENLDMMEEHKWDLNCWLENVQMPDKLLYFIFLIVRNR